MLSRHLRNPWPRDSFVIPIGNDCSIAHHMRRCGIRTTALPFDWVVTPVESSMLLIERHFADFLQPSNLAFGTPTKRLYFSEDTGGLEISNESITPVIDLKYNILFPHDFRTSTKDEVDAVRMKYARRCKRVIDILSRPNPHSVTFVACDNAISEWQRERYKEMGCTYTNTAFAQWKRLLGEKLAAIAPQHHYSFVDYPTNLGSGGVLRRTLSLLNRTAKRFRDWGQS